MKVQPYVAIVARVLLALMFVLAGLSKFGDLSGTAGYIASKGLPMPTVLATATALLEFGAGLALMLGWRARYDLDAMVRDMLQNLRTVSGV